MTIFARTDLMGRPLGHDEACICGECRIANHRISMAQELATLRAELARVTEALDARQGAIDEWAIATDESVRLCETDTGAWTEEQWQRAEDRVSARVIAAENALTALATPANQDANPPKEE